MKKIYTKHPSTMLWGNMVNESENQQKNIAGILAHFFGGAATHTVSCVAHSTNAQSLL